MTQTAEILKLETKRTRDGQTLFTLSRLAREFRLARNTVTRRLEGVPAAGKDRRGYEGWTLDVAAPLLLQVGDSRKADPKLRPFDEDKYYAAQLKKLQLQRELGQVVEISTVRREWAEIVKKLVAFLQALPDQLERLLGLTPTQVQKLERLLDEQRGDLHAELAGDDHGDE